MTYEIISNVDELSKAHIVVRVPEEEIDGKALYTLQAERPDFVLPFTYRNVDGQIELKFQIGNFSKIKYMASPCSAEELTDATEAALTPVLDCDDWFLNPYSFVMDIEYVFCDKGCSKFAYLYIPSTRPCSDFEALKNVVLSLLEIKTVDDPRFLNDVFNSILRGFNPRELLRMMKGRKAVARIDRDSALMPTTPPATPATPITPTAPSQPDVSLQAAPQAALWRTAAPQAPAPFPNAAAPASERAASGDIEIRFSNDKKKPKEKPEKEKKSKPEKKQEKEFIKFGGFFAKKPKPEPAPAMPQPAQYAYPDAPLAPAESPDTQLEEIPILQTGLRYMGFGNLPKYIPVELQVGDVFTVGRFDKDVGIAQSSFEFDKGIKSVSRRHAAIERTDAGYWLIDLSSTYGTYVDGEKLAPNTPAKLRRNVRVSFGFHEADYVWLE